VRLKVEVLRKEWRVTNISIPFGAIKSGEWIVFLLRNTGISIPFGAIKRH